MFPCLILRARQDESQDDMHTSQNCSICRKTEDADDMKETATFFILGRGKQSYRFGETILKYMNNTHINSPNTGLP